MGRRGKKRDEDSTTNVGATMTVSLFLILLTFFILLNSIAVLDDRKVREAIGSLTGSFGSLSGGLSPLDTGTSIMPSSSPMIDPKVDLEQLLLSVDEMVLSQVRVEKDRNRDTVVIGERDLFHENRHTFISPISPLLNRLCRFIRQGRYQIEIVGHTDDQSGEEKGYRSNWELSSLMALQVLKYFIKQGGIAPERLTAYGRSDLSPVLSNSTRDSRARNRRIEIVLEYKAPAYAKRAFTDKPAGVFTYKRFNFKVF